MLVEPASVKASLASTIAQWRSFRHMQRIQITVFVILSLFLLNWYRVSLADTSSISKLPPVTEEAPPPEPTEDPLKVAEDAARREKELAMEQSMEHAGNSTLGFHAIYYINMKERYDREDAMALQAYLSGLDLQDVPAVQPEMIDPVGMPPTHRPGKLKVGEKGCWRAHANIWSEMVRKKLPPVLVLESDAAWDISVRPIMSELNKHFVEFLRSINSTAVPDASWGSKNKRTPPKPEPTPSFMNGTMFNTTVTPPPPPPPPPIDYNPDDPWLSEHWDLFSLGHCWEANENHDINLVYDDPHVPKGKDYWGRKLGHERVIRKSGGIVCTTAFAISHTGAAKLLLRGALDLDNPVDLLIRRLTMSDDLVAYSVTPPIMAQWMYREDIGMGQRGAQSDINGGKHKDTPEDAEMEGWDDVSSSGSVWIPRHSHDTAFEKMALHAAWDQLMGDSAVLADSWWDPKTGN